MDQSKCISLFFGNNYQWRNPKISWNWGSLKGPSTHSPTRPNFIKKYSSSLLSYPTVDFSLWWITQPLPWNFGNTKPVQTPLNRRTTVCLSGNFWSQGTIAWSLTGDPAFEKEIPTSLLVCSWQLSKTCRNRVCSRAKDILMPVFECVWPLAFCVIKVKSHPFPISWCVSWLIWGYCLSDILWLLGKKKRQP